MRCIGHMSESCLDLGTSPHLSHYESTNFLKIYLFYVYEYTVAVQMVVSLHVVAGN